MENATETLGGIAGARARRRALTALPWADAAAAGLSFAVVVMLATHNGGYWPTASSWTGLLLAWLALLMLLVAPQVVLSRWERVFVASILALVGWTAVAAAWSDSVPRTMEEVQRGAAYLGIVLACLLVARAHSYGSLLLGTWAAISVTCAYGLGTRLLPNGSASSIPSAGTACRRPSGTGTGSGFSPCSASSSLSASPRDGVCAPACPPRYRCSSSSPRCTSRSAAAPGWRSASGSRSRSRSILAAFSSASRRWRSVRARRSPSSSRRATTP